MNDWLTIQNELARFAQTQLFFVGGAPRSGTTWLQQMLDAHPDVSCRGEGLFQNHLAVPLEQMMTQRAKIIASKNQKLFGHTGGYPQPVGSEVEFLIGSTIISNLYRQTEGKNFRAVGEKTPENVFFFPRLKQLFPRAKFIAIARDPRDVVVSAWHFFGQTPPDSDPGTAQMAFIQRALPSIASGTRAMLQFGQENPRDYCGLTYEALHADPAALMAHLFRLIGVSDRADLVAECVARHAFGASSQGRPTGNGAFLRKGVVGDWRNHLTDEMNDAILKELGWMFPIFGWEK